MSTREAASSLSALVARCEADLAEVAAARATGDKLADQVGGELALRWRLAVLRAVIDAPPDPDAVRELYGELCDRYRDDAKSLTLVRGLGDEIRRREADGTLPSTMVVRSDRRKKT